MTSADETTRPKNMSIVASVFWCAAALVVAVPSRRKTR
jgi:hypothetical protein